MRAIMASPATRLGYQDGGAQMTKQLKKLVGEELPAVFSNRFYARLGDLSRINFMEVVPGGSQTEHPRVAVQLLREDAIALANLILQLAKAAPGAAASTGGSVH